MMTCITFISYAKTAVPVFLLSGQSNMEGFSASVNDLTADQKKLVNNVKIIQFSQGEVSTLEKWLTLGPGFGLTASNLGPELSFGRTLSDSMPGKKIAFIKDAIGATFLGLTNGWLPPSSNNGTGGTLYNNMMMYIDKALKTFNTAYDTAQYKPVFAGFVWFQGEYDAYNIDLSKAYEKNLTNLIKDIRVKVMVSDLPVIIPMIDTQAEWTNNAIVRAADVTVKQKLINVDTLDTKGFPTDGIHYTAAGHIKIGILAAKRWLNMHYKYDPAVSVTFNSPLQVMQQKPISSLSGIFFDISGRQIKDLNNSFHNTSGGVFITTYKEPGVQQKKIFITK
jgi:hypothetical protein